MSDDIGADSTLEREIAPILSIGDAFPKILITRTRHEPHTREGVLVLNFARWLLTAESILARNSPGIPGKGAVVLVHIVRYADAFVFHPTTIFKAYYKKVCSHG